MLKHVLVVCFTAVFLTACLPEDDAGLSFDVSGHWEVSPPDGNGDPFIAMVTPKGKWMSHTPNESGFMFNGNEDAVYLDEDDVEGDLIYCKSAEDVSDCMSLEVDLDIENDNRLTGDLDPNNDEDREVAIILTRQTELDRRIDLSDYEGGWVSEQSVNATLLISSDGSFTGTDAYGHSMAGAFVQIDNNMFSYKNTITTDTGTVEFSGLGFIDGDNKLRIAGLIVTPQGEIQQANYATYSLQK